MGIFDDEFMVPEPSPEEGQEGGTQAPEEGQPASKGEGVPETKPEDITPEPKQEPKQEPKDDLILGKFKDVEALATGYVNLMNRLGQQYNLEQFENVEQLTEAYRAAERQLGGQRQAPQPNAEVEQLRQQLAMQQYQLQQMAQYFQAVQMQQAYQQPQQQQQVDPSAFLDQLYEKGPEAITPIVQQIVNAELQRAGRDFGVQIGQMLKPVYQKMQTDETLANWNAQAERLMSEVNDFDEYREEMMAMFESPNTAQELVALTQSHPNGIYMALRSAYDRAKANRLSQDGQAFQTEMRKHAARLGGSSGRMTGVKQTPEDIIKQQIFGDSQEGGIFG